MTPAVLSYPTSNNLGDPIQRIAAEHLLSETPKALDRDHLDRYQGSPVRLVMNGWFMECPEHWPPAKNIHPVFISFHLNPTAASAMLSPKGIAYFKAHQPIGCRDYYTQTLLESHGIKTFFSGCLTLTLRRERLVAPKTPRSGVLVLSVHERMLPEWKSLKQQSLKALFENAVQLAKYPFKYIKCRKAKNQLTTFLAQQDLPIHYASQLVATDQHNEAERHLLAMEQLVNIAQAAYVITSRIHTALPAVALGTPVLFLSDGLEHPNQSSRLKGLDLFFPILKTANLKQYALKDLKPSTAHHPYVAQMKDQLKTTLKLRENDHKD